MVKRVLQVNTTANWGSTGKIAEQIGITAIANGWESYVAYGRWMNESKSHIVKIGTPIEIKMHGVKAKLFGRHGLGSVSGTRKFINAIKEIAPDVIHLHNITGYYINYKLLFEFLAEYNKPVVWTLHDCWAFTGRCTHFVRNGCYKWINGCENCVFKHIYPDTWFLDYSKSDYALKKRLFSAISNLTVVTVSDWLASFVRQSFLASHKIEVIHNGTDLNVFSPRARNENNHRKFSILGVCNRWGKSKGLDDFIALRNLLPVEEYDIIMVGLNEKQLTLLPKGIRGIKRTDSVQELAALYASADVFWNPTHEDNFPTVNIEALACGTPVVTYKTGGSPEAVDTDTGFVVEQDDLKGVIRAIDIIKTKGRNWYVGKCRERAEKEFDMKKQFMKYIAVYERNMNY